MRIAFVSQEYPPDTAHGGIGTQTFAKAHGLAGLGHDVTVISHGTDGNRKEASDGAVHVIRVPGFDAHMLIQTEPVRWLTYSAIVAAEVAALHARRPLDVVDFPEWGCEAYVHLLNRTAWNPIPTVIHLHGPLIMFAHTMGWPEIDSEFYRTGTVMESTCLRLADLVISSSKCSADWCVRHYGLEPSQIPIWHSGVDTEHFRPQSVERATRPTIVFAGKITASKGVDSLLDAACLLVPRYPDLSLRLLGRGDDRFVEQLQSIARNQGCPDLLDIAGFVHRQDLPRELSRGHVFAAPSIYEGGPGFVYLEAMACGLPVIAAAESGVSEVVTDGENGLLVNSGDLESLVVALDSLLRDEARRLAMGNRARRYVEREASSNNAMQRLETHYAVANGRAMSDYEGRRAHAGVATHGASLVVSGDGGRMFR